jgi:hypothetical protein
VRDLLEIEFLADLFRREPDAPSRWISLDERKRRKEFKPVRVREKLDELDGYTTKRRAAIYNLLSQHAAHANPSGFHIISPDSMTQIGPFVSSTVLKAFLEELAQHLMFATSHLFALLGLLAPEAESELNLLRERWTNWRSKYVPSASRG